jgi:hypothetical protein
MNTGFYLVAVPLTFLAMLVMGIWAYNIGRVVYLLAQSAWVNVANMFKTQKN